MAEYDPLARVPKPEPGAEAKRIVIKPRQWESEHARREVDLIQRQFGSDEWEVYLPDGTWIGTVGRYTGSLDTKIAGTRLRREGKRRTLWSERGTYPGARSFFGEVSRADAIRSLINAHERKGRL